jgi:hypothetical protein
MSLKFSALILREIPKVYQALFKTQLILPTNKKTKTYKSFTSTLKH